MFQVKLNLKQLSSGQAGLALCPYGSLCSMLLGDYMQFLCNSDHEVSTLLICTSQSAQLDVSLSTTTSSVCALRPQGLSTILGPCRGAWLHYRWEISRLAGN